MAPGKLHWCQMTLLIAAVSAASQRSGVAPTVAPAGAPEPSPGVTPRDLPSAIPDQDLGAVFLIT